MDDATKPAVMVVDDERVIAWDLREMINAMGYDCFAIASSATEALAAAEKRKPDLVLMDIRLKGPLDGIDTAKLLQERFGVRVIFLSAHSRSDTAERASEIRAAAWLTKPISATVLRRTLAEAFSRS